MGGLTPVFGQKPDSSYVDPSVKQPPKTAPSAPALTRFSLDFPGGTTLELLKAIEKALGKPLNVIISTEDGLPPLTEFNLDFPGGTPAELVKAIEKAMDKPLNVIIPTEDAAIQLPPLKMNDVVTVQLFAALDVASRRIVSGYTLPGAPPGTLGTASISYGFRTVDSRVSDASIWYFHAERSGTPAGERVCRFYTLATYLDCGFTVDDITTAIQTGWKMAGATPLPELNYHKETKLLIAYGESSQLRIIDNVLESLPRSNATQDEIAQLKKQVDELKKRIPAPAPTAAPGEKSGK